MNTGGARQLRDPLDAHFHFLAGHSHQVRQFVDDHDDKRHRLQVRLRFFGDFLVVAGDVAHPDLREDLVAVFHHHDDDL